jgi:hypothetical protein
MTKEVLKLALEALEYHTVQTRPIHQTNIAITAIKEALAQQSGWRKVQIDDAEEEAWKQLEKKNDTA